MHSESNLIVDLCSTGDAGDVWSSNGDAWGPSIAAWCPRHVHARDALRPSAAPRAPLPPPKLCLHADPQTCRPLPLQMLQQARSSYISGLGCQKCHCFSRMSQQMSGHASPEYSGHRRISLGLCILLCIKCDASCACYSFAMRSIGMLQPVVWHL